MDRIELIGGEGSPPTPREIRLGDKPQSGFLFEAQFINVDLNVERSRSLAALTLHLAAHDELNSDLDRPPPPSANGTVLALLNALEAMSPDVLAVWQSARRTFDVGYDADVVRRVAALGASFTTTVHAFQPQNQ
jgi:hypothetical protein